ncbi:MAG: PEP/pyruvate-binding domain-containing protein [Bacteriovoracaceae bacterium]
MIYDFLQLDKGFNQVGAKAYVLAMMAQQNLPVPAGMILSHLPLEEDWPQIESWWKKQNYAPLAVRSSAFGEDSDEMSFAGQNQTFLNVKTIDELKSSVTKCFKSIDREASQSYRQFFMGEKKEVPMNVVLQVMVDAKYAGVYFSVNPTRAESGAVLEYVEGLGESLVSGQVNPFRIFKQNTETSGPLDRAVLDKVFTLGEEVEKQLSQKIDMEWAVDASLNVHLLQARPITSARSEVRQKIILQAELDRIQKDYPDETWWDGQTFAEWTGQPSRLTYEVWKRAFAPGGAFDLALQEMGYLGFTNKSYSPHESIMDRLFGHAYIDMSKMVPLYFGPIPYRIEPYPRPHLKFEWHKIGPVGILNTPKSLWRMIKVGWNMSTNRRQWIEKSRKELVDFKHKMQRPQSGSMYAEWKNDELLNLWQKEVANFSRISLKWPLVLVVLIEATHQSLRAVLSSVVGQDQVEAYLGRWMGAGLKTATFEMNRYFTRALEEPLKREFFFSRFGHRGPGELDLSHPRWEELGESAFGGGKTKEAVVHADIDVEAEIHQLKTFKDAVLIEEWRLLKEMLELREQWKMEILRPYAHIRYISLEIGKRTGLVNDIFNLTVEEVTDLMNKKLDFSEIKSVVKNRKEELDSYKGIYLPDVLKKLEVKECFNNSDLKASTLRGIPLSHGIVKGTVRVVNDPSEVDFSDWPDDAILVAPATDPGWTALFTRSRGVIVERGGVLSHCAILARELGLPGINLPRATQVLKNGDKIWLDGHNGGVKNDTVA